jgi:transglutaminase-like putative cysteine protease
MSLERALQLHTAVLAALGVLFVGLGHENPLLPGLIVLAVLGAALVTDVFRLLCLNRWLANLLALVAVAWALKDFFLMSSDGQLLAIANMLGYLQVVLLVQEKSARIYWQLLVLSLLQVVVAAALDLGPEFGFLLCGYVVIGVSALILLCVYRQTPSAIPSPSGDARTGSASSKPRSPAQLLLAPPQVHALAAPADSWCCLPRGFLARQVSLLTIVTFLFAAIFFYAAPRLNDGSWQGARRRGAGTAGVTPQVKLPEAGRIHLSGQIAMRVALTRQQDKQPVPLAQDPYFHGAVLTEYVNDENGYRWLPRTPPNLPLGQRNPSPAPQLPLTSAGLVQQDIVLEAVSSNLAYAIMPVVENPPRGLRYSRYQSHLFRSTMETSATARQHRYSVKTPALRSGRQLHGVPHNNPLITPRDQWFLDNELAELRAFDPQRFPRLTQAAAEVIERLDLQDASPLDKALALERNFRTNEQYQYSLNLDFERNRDLDPIEDFVANHKRGHCEYYASALVMMLRSQGIPARMVIGYKGGVYNSLGRYYIVQQRFSHAWVEAWMPDGIVPEDEIAGRPSKGGCWYRLDPTPGRAVPLLANEEGVGQRLVQAFDYLELLWRDYVLSLNAARQQDALYDPLTERAAVLPSWVESRSLQRMLRRWSMQLGLDFTVQRDGGGRRFFEGSLALIVAASLLGLLALAQAARITWRMASNRWRSRRGQAAAGASCAPGFYLRLEKLLARLHLRRHEGQTARELAAAAGLRLGGASSATARASLPSEIVAAYYRVRFGGDRLDKNETAAIEQDLAELARAVREQNRS